MNGIESRNFGFLGQHDPLLLHCAVRAELYAFDDPNASLMKSRQLAEYLALRVAAEHGVETAGMTFSDVLRQLGSRRLVPRAVRDHFDIVRLRGNEAAHSLDSSRQTALANLISVHWLSVWFHRMFVDGGFSPGPFRPPVVPSQAAQALREEVDELRAEVARYEQDLATVRGQSVKLTTLVETLNDEARRFEEEVRRSDLAREESETERVRYQRELERVRREAARSTPADLQSFIERARWAARSLSISGGRDEVIPITRIRFPITRKSRCHGAALLLGQHMKGGFVKAYCFECKKSDSVGEDEFKSLDLWVSCPRCPTQRLNAGKVRYSNYGYSCPQCGWTCLLASLLPNWDEL